MWRPPNWAKVLEKICGENPHSYDVYYVEAGADAMLEALFKMAEESPTKTFVIDSQVIAIYREG